MGAAFDRLHRDVQRKLHEMKWTELNATQVDAIDHLLGAEPTDCVISAPTAGGKTEAAFLPVVSSLAAQPPGGLGAMYIGPLKALINDQFRRVEDLCARLALPVHRWHGDVSDTQRKAFLAAPAGILLITPESLEAMFVLRPTAMPGLFGRLRYIVIDEMHAFLGGVRGAQLISQLHRLRSRTGADPLRIGLSATLGDPDAAGRWLRPDGRRVRLIAQTAGGSEIALRVRGFWREPAPAESEEEEEVRDEALVEAARSLLLAARGKTNLVFANSKSLIETLADELYEQARALGLPDEIVVHHGSLSKESREHAEERLRADRPCTAVCSNTLEMGIDIGAIDEVVQVSAPWSVASLVQRLGRSGRRPGSRRVLRGYFIEEKADANLGFWRRLHLDFVRGIAMIELLLERFVEAPSCDRAHLSTLVQQILSTLAETGGIRAHDLYDRVVSSGAFHGVGKAQLAAILRELGARDLLTQLPDQTLVLGLAGQRLVGHYSFYAAFRASVDFQVLHGTRLIGLLPETSIPPAGEHVILAGRRWLVQDVDPDRKQLHVIPSRGRRPPRFVRGAGDVDPRVHERMRDLLLGASEPPYLDETALEILRHGRESARVLDPGRLLYPLDNGVRVLLWGGTRLHRTLILAFIAAGLKVSSESDVGFDVSGDRDAIADVLRSLAAADGLALAEVAERRFAAKVTEGDKFDEYLPVDLWRRAYVAERLDVPAARQVATRLLEEIGRAETSVALERAVAPALQPPSPALIESVAAPRANEPSEPEPRQLEGLRLVFDPAIDRGGWPGALRDQDAVVGVAWLGPLGLLARLELELGLGGNHPPALLRIAELARTLAGSDGWWRASYDADPLSTCERLLRDRDTLAMWGWRGEPVSERLATLWTSTVTARPGLPDRLEAVRHALARRRPDIDVIELATPFDLLEPAWRAVFAALAEAGVQLSERPAVAASSTGDLARARDPGFTLAGDGSLVLLRAQGPLAAADEVAAWLASLPDRAGVVIVGADEVLDAALQRHGLPRTGASTEAPASLALVRLVISAAFEPMDPRDLHALLCMDPGPVPRQVARGLIAALREWPSRRAPAWRTALAEGVARCDVAWRADVEQRLAAFLTPVARRDERVPAGKIVRRLRVLGSWARSRLHATPDLVALARVVDDACTLIGDDGSCGLVALERLCDELDDASRVVAAEVGLAAVSEPGAVLGPAHTIVWWGFTRDTAPRPHRPRLSGAEREGLQALGVAPPDTGHAMRAEAMRWRRPLMCAARHLVLVCPRTDDAGEPSFPHPLWDELRASMRDGERLDCLERSRLPGHRVVVALCTRPSPATTVQVPVPLSLRAVESPSSLERLLGCSVAWALQYHGRVYDGFGAALGAPGPWLFGSLAHHVLGESLRTGVRDADAAAARAREMMVRELPGLCESLELPLYQLERTTLQHAIVTSARELGRLLEQTGAVVRGAEVAVRGAWDGLTMQGNADLMLAEPDMIIDLKWGISGQREKMEKGTALQLAAYAATQVTAHEVLYLSLRTQELLGTAGCRVPGARRVGAVTAAETWSAGLVTVGRRRAELAAGSLHAPAADGSKVVQGLGPDALTVAPSCKYCRYGVLCGQAPCR